MQHLLSGSRNEDAIEGLCKLLATCGGKFILQCFSPCLEAMLALHLTSTFAACCVSAKLEETLDRTTLERIAQYYDTLRLISTDDTMSFRARIMVQDLLDLRDNK